jgi:hypothetical protein
MVADRRGLRARVGAVRSGVRGARRRVLRHREPGQRDLSGDAAGGRPARWPARRFGDCFGHCLVRLAVQAVAAAGGEDIWYARHASASSPTRVSMSSSCRVRVPVSNEKLLILNVPVGEAGLRPVWTLLAMSHSRR